MIICHCNRIGHREIARACAELAEAKPGVPVTAAAVYGALGVKPRCGRCAALVAQFVPGVGEADACAPVGCDPGCTQTGGEVQNAAPSSQELPAA